MSNVFINNIKSDLRESKINWKVTFLFIPIAFLSYLFHEFGHWSLGELFGNDMTMNLNNCSPTSGSFSDESAKLWSAIGGPAFTIFQALIFLVITQKTKSIYAYSVLFFAVFMRFFSLVFGGLSLQDEAGISNMLHLNIYLVPAVVLLILFTILWKGSRVTKLKMKGIGYFTVLATLAILLVIGVDKLIM